MAHLIIQLLSLWQALGILLRTIPYKLALPILQQFVRDIRDNIFETYTSQIQIPKTIYNRNDNDYTMNDLWKEIDKLKGIIYWYESAMKGHLSYCDEQFNKVINISINNNNTKD